jgi:hypothetical protein
VGWVGGPFSHITSLNFVLVSLPVFSGSKRPQQTFFFPFFYFYFSSFLLPRRRRIFFLYTIKSTPVFSRL